MANLLGAQSNAETVIGVLREVMERIERGRTQVLTRVLHCGPLRAGLIGPLLGAVLVAGLSTARAQTLTTLFSFARSTDGGTPFAALPEARTEELPSPPLFWMPRVISTAQPRLAGPKRRAAPTSVVD